MAYRNWGGQLQLKDLTSMLCAVEKGRYQPNTTSTGPIYSLPGVRSYKVQSDATVDTNIDGPGGSTNRCISSTGRGMLGFENVTIDVYVAPSSLSYTEMHDRKVLCFKKSVGTPYAVYQIKAGDGANVNNSVELQYQVKIRNTFLRPV